MILLRSWLIFICSTNEVDNVAKRPGLLKNPRYANTRVDEVFPAIKSRFRVVSGKENAKVIIFAKLMTPIQLGRLTSSFN